MKLSSKILGMTLMELIVVIAIVALLASIAYPNYVRLKQTTRRADAQAAVIATQAIVERYLSENNKANIDADDLDLTQFENYSAGSGTPVLSTGSYYKVSIVPETVGYTINATAVADGTTNACSVVANAQALDQCSDSNCWVISITNGAKTSTNSTGVVANETTTTCW